MLLQLDFFSDEAFQRYRFDSEFSNLKSGCEIRDEIVLPNSMIRILVLAFLVSFDFVVQEVSAAFQSSPLWSLQRSVYLDSPFCTELCVKSKRPKGTSSPSDDVNRKNGWNDLKRVFYNSIDGVNSLTSKMSSGREERGGNDITDGYRSIEQSLKQGATPASKLVERYEAKASALGVVKTRSSLVTAKKKTRTSFDAFKESLYSASDAFGALPIESPQQTPLYKLGKNIPYKKTLVQELGASERVDDLFSDNPIKRFQAQQEIREREARLRAEVRNERIRAKKEDLYKVVDAMQAVVDSFPESMDKTEKAIRDSIVFVKEVPSTVGMVVEDVKAIPKSVKMKADQTKKVVEETIGKTKKVVEGAIDIPQKVNQKVQDAQNSVTNTKESIDEGVNTVKVALRLEKPKPMPPKSPPPKPKSAKDIAFRVAGGAATGVGKVAWWATRSIATAAWNGAQSAVKEQGMVVAKKPKTPSITPPNSLEKRAAELQKEVDEALRLAEETLRKVDEDF